MLDVQHSIPLLKIELDSLLEVNLLEENKFDTHEFSPILHDYRTPTGQLRHVALRHNFREANRYSQNW